MQDMQAEFGVSFNYLRTWRGKEAAPTSLRGDDAKSYKANLVYPDAAFRICVQHLAANLKTRRFQVDQIHCPHAMAVCNHRRIDPHNYYSNYYTKYYLYACYAHVVHPIGSAEGWDVSEEVRSQIVNPPNTKRGPGRLRVRRILSQ
ncbi:hypothetical protein TIFTF001_051151, partial [Ficus carica]